MKTIKLLDCTLRDGGQGLEDAYLNNRPYKPYTSSEVSYAIGAYNKSGIDIVELGSIDPDKETKIDFCTYRTLEEVSKSIPEGADENSPMYVALYRGPDTDISDIPDYREGMCRGVRVIIRYSEMVKSMEFCKALSMKGYKVFVQPMLTMRYTDEQLAYIIREANEMHAFAVYFVDSYGYMMTKDIERIYEIYDKGLDPEIAIGFHAHNNMDMAMANAIAFLNACSDKRVNIVDACACGIGQGAGNLQTEVIANFLNLNFDKEYDLTRIIGVCEKIDSHNVDGLWGYSLTKFIPARNKTAYKYAVSLKHKYGLGADEINVLLGRIPEELRHRYTEENVLKLLEYRE